MNKLSSTFLILHTYHKASTQSSKMQLIMDIGDAPAGIAPQEVDAIADWESAASADTAAAAAAIAPGKSRAAASLE